MSRGSRNGKCGCVLARTPPQIMRGEGDRQHKSPRSRSNKPCTHFELVPRPYLHPPSKKPGAAGGSGRTQAWEGHARETHCRRPPSHAQPDAYLGRTRPPPSSPAPVPTSCQEQPPPPTFHPQGLHPPESRRPRPVPYLIARSSPLSPSTPAPTRAQDTQPGQGVLRRACVCEHSRAPVRARRWMGGGVSAGEASTHLYERVPRCCAPSRRRERAGLLCSPASRWAARGRSLLRAPCACRERELGARPRPGRACTSSRSRAQPPGWGAAG